MWKLENMAVAKPLLVGKYKFDRSENVDEYLAALGCGMVVRKVQSVTRPDLEISFDPSSQLWKIRRESIFHNYELEFKLGEPVDSDETFDIRPCRTTVVKDDQSNCNSNSNAGVLLMTQIPKEGLPVTTRIVKLKNGSVRFEMECGGNKATQIFKAADGSGSGGSSESVQSSESTSTTEDDVANGNVLRERNASLTCNASTGV